MAQTSTAAHTAFDPATVRAQFPILERDARGHRMVYLDNAATTQKPLAVLDGVRNHDAMHNANVHRGVHLLTEEATRAYEGARQSIARFLNANGPDEVVFTRGTTESINLIAHSGVGPRLSPGDEIIVSHLEHHANIVPWQLLCERTGAVLRVIPVNDRGELLFDEFLNLLSEKTKAVSVVHVSNAIGSVNPVERICEAARQAGALCIVDGAQSTAHERVDVQGLGCDFFVFSGHKMYGPTGIGALWGRREILREMPPYQGGGEMIRCVTFEGSTFADPPARFEAGTPNITGAVGLGAAVEFLNGFDMAALARHEMELTELTLQGLREVPKLRIIGEPAKRGPIVSFVVDGIHAHDLATALDTQGVMVREGGHCAQPLLARLGVPATARASFAMYNTREEVETFLQTVHKAVEMFNP